MAAVSGIPWDGTRGVQSFNEKTSLHPKNSSSGSRINSKVLLITSFLCVGVVIIFCIPKQVFDKSTFGIEWSSDKAQPYSTVNPMSLGVLSIKRPSGDIAAPGPIFRTVLEENIPLPTNSWCENLFVGTSNVNPENKVFEVPYVLDTGGKIPGVRTHSVHVQGADTEVQMTYEPQNALTLGAVETFLSQHEIVRAGTNSIAVLAIVLQWDSPEYRQTGQGSFMQIPIVRGAPYTSMMYNQATPHIFSERALSRGPIVDGVQFDESVCGVGHGVFSAKPITVQAEIQLSFDTSDMTWMIFFSEATEFECSNYNPLPQTWKLPAGVVPPVDSENSPIFELRAIHPMNRGMVRIAVSNNCTLGQNPQFCEHGKGRDQTAFTQLLREHADIYPTGEAKIHFMFPMGYEIEEETRLNFDWMPASMSELATKSSIIDEKVFEEVPAIELLMYAIPHHQERIQPVPTSSNRVLDIGCVPNIHGITCPVIGGYWSLLEHAHRTSFFSAQSPRSEMISDIDAALKQDIEFQIPENYMYGAGDTYFSGKMLAKLARILLIADEMDSVPYQKFHAALDRLRAGVEIWLNGSANSPLLYDESYGGIVMCGCDYNGTSKRCNNKFPNCPALSDIGQNFGAGFYNDHHYHFGYHIYAAAVVSKYDARWGRKFFQNVLLLIRDIANPSVSDPFFPLWRHKDWFIGSSWAKGVVTIGGRPYPNGCNQESSSEAISAYEAVALYGAVLAGVFEQSLNIEDQELFETAQRISDMGRLLLGTELRSAKTYWHVQKPGAAGVTRIYPPVYSPKVVGMMWSLLAQRQTWFGNEPWKSYGIQLMPLTVAAELRDSPSWVLEMLPEFNQSCASDPHCAEDGWSVLVYACMATVGRWQEARAGVLSLDDSVFEGAGGNGHSRSNSLWFIATRPNANFSSTTG